MSKSTEGKTPTPSLSGAIFDCDGVLVDSEPLHNRATELELRSRGLTIDDDFFERHVGMRVVDQMGLLAMQFDLDASELHEFRERRFWALAEGNLAEVPGSRSAVRRAYDAGLRVAIATSGSRRWIEHVIDFLDIRHFLTVVISGDDVAEPKPDPECYLTAAAALELAPSSCGVVEDSRHGFTSASAAGCQVIVLDRNASHTSPFKGALAVVESMSEASDLLVGPMHHW